MERILRFLIYGTYPFLAWSVLFLMGMGFGAAFVSDFTVENRTGEGIVVTPVGTVGREGHREPLPVKMFAFPPLPALRAGGFRLAPGEAVRIRYDMDDINFSEIVVEDEQGRLSQLVTDPDPTSRQYHGPLQKLYIIDEFSSLGVEVAPDVLRASVGAQRQGFVAVAIWSVLFGPWLVYGVLVWLVRQCRSHAAVRRQFDPDGRNCADRE